VVARLCDPAQALVARYLQHLNQKGYAAVSVLALEAPAKLKAHSVFLEILPAWLLLVTVGHHFRRDFPRAPAREAAPRAGVPKVLEVQQPLGIAEELPQEAALAALGEDSSRNEWLVHQMPVTAARKVLCQIAQAEASRAERGEGPSALMG